MKKKNRIFALILILVLSAGALMSCGRSNVVSSSEMTENVEQSETKDGENADEEIVMASKEKNEAKEDQTITKEEILADPDHEVQFLEYNGFYFYDVRSKDSSGKAPLMIFLHGLDDTKENQYGLAQEFADKGYVCVIPDLYGHGETGISEDVSLVDMAVKSSYEICGLLQYYSNSDYADSDRFALGGMSLGALSTLYYISAMEPLPQCAVCFCGTANWRNLSGVDAVFITRKDNKNCAVTDKDQYAEIMAGLYDNSPDNNTDQLVTVPILMVNGTEDEIIPVAGVKEFKARAQMYPNCAITFEIDDRDHDILSGDYEKMEAYVEEHMPAESR